MLFVQGGCKPGDTVLIQGAGGGVATALIALARAGGLKVLATSRDESKRQRALELGAHEVYETGQRLPITVDAVMETVGQATWLHSIRSLRVGGTLVTSGATSGNAVAGHGSHPDLLPAAQGRRLDDGHPRASWRRSFRCSTRPASARSSIARSRWSGPARASPRWTRRALRQGRLHPMKVLLTGAGSGIGEAMADALHDRGDDLVLLARNEQRAQDLRDRFAAPTSAPPTWPTPRRWRRSCPTWTGWTRWCTPPASSSCAPVAEMKLEDLAGQLSVNLVAPTELTRALLPALRAARGTVVFLNSGAGLVAHPGWSAYAASKFGLRAVADALRAEEAGHGVRVTSVYLGRVATPMQEKVHEQEGKDYDAGEWVSPASVVSSVLHVLDLPADVTVPDVTVRPRPR